MSATPTEMPVRDDKPDLDWSQVKETVRMLNVAVAQVEIAMHDGNDSVNTLTESFAAMMNNVGEIQHLVAGAEIEDQALKDRILSLCGGVATRMGQSVVAFQFYDKLSQRLAHVNDMLASLGDLVSDDGRLFNPYAWRELQRRIRARYSMREEQKMFDAVLAGKSIEEALAEVRDTMADLDDEIELF